VQLESFALKSSHLEASSARLRAYSSTALNTLDFKTVSSFRRATEVADNFSIFRES
jgi:hypothetical protein